SESIQGVQQWREIQLRRRRQTLRCARGIARIADESVIAFIDGTVAVGNLFGAAIAETLEILHITLNRLGKIVEAERQQVGIGESQHRGAADLRQRLLVDESGVAEVSEPVKVIEDRVVD